MSRSLLLSSVLVLSVGCAGAGNGLRAERGSARMGQHSAEPLVVSDHSITGPSSSLALSEAGMRGRFRDQPVDLKWDFQRVTGMVGAQAAKLELSEGDDTRASGSFGGARVDMLLKDDVLLARVGACAYYMTKVDGGFSGKRDCAGPVEEQFYVDFPESLQARPLGQMATLLTLALVNYTDTYSPDVSMARFAAVRELGESVPKDNCRRSSR